MSCLLSWNDNQYLERQLVFLCFCITCQPDFLPSCVIDHLIEQNLSFTICYNVTVWLCLTIFLSLLSSQLLLARFSIQFVIFLQSLKSLNVVMSYTKEEESWLNDRLQMLEEAYRSVSIGRDLINAFLLCSEGHPFPGKLLCFWDVAVSIIVDETS